MTDHNFTGRREWGMYPSDDRLCQICGIQKGRHGVMDDEIERPHVPEPKNEEEMALEELYRSHELTPEGIELLEDMRAHAISWARALANSAPKGYLRDAAVLAISDALMACNRAISVDGLKS